MKVLKVGMRLMACFEIGEFINILLTPLENRLLTVMLTNRLEGKNVNTQELDEVAKQFGKNSAKNKDYEYWTAIYCFYLKNIFDLNRHTIDSYEDLEKYKDDPPDVIIRDKQGNLFEFELKRYTDVPTEDGITNFIIEKIVKHYSTTFNFCIILQSTPETVLPIEIFENLHKRIKDIPAMKENIGKICFIFNANNQYDIFAHIYPDLYIYKTPFVSGSNKVKNILKPTSQV
jgi:hypothetical protein